MNDPILLKLAEDRFWLSLADSDALLYALGVQAFAGMDVTIREPDVSPLQLQGPRSKDVIRKLFGDDVTEHEVLLVRRRPSSTGSRSSSRGPAGRARSATSCTCATPRAASSCGMRVMAAGRGVRDPGHRAERPAPDGGGDLQLRQRHGRHEQSLRGDRPGAARRARQRQRGRLARRAGAGRGRRACDASSSVCGSRASRSAMWLEDFWPVSADGEVVGRLTSASLLAPSGVQHGLRLGADRARDARHACCSWTRRRGRWTPRSYRCRSWIRRRTCRRAETSPIGDLHGVEVSCGGRLGLPRGPTRREAAHLERLAIRPELPADGRARSVITTTRVRSA